MRSVTFAAPREGRGAGDLFLLSGPRPAHDSADHVYDREELGVESSTQAGDAFTSHQLWLKVWERLDGKLMLPETWVKGTGIAA